MSYTKTTDFQAKDALASGNPSKIIKGTEIDDEFDAIQVADALNLKRDGTTTASADIPMGSHKFTGLAVGTANTDSLTLGQAQNQGFLTLSSVAGTNTITGSLTPAITAYVAGQKFNFIAAGANTGATTLNINSLGAKDVTKMGTTALVSGDIPSGAIVEVEYDGTRFQLCNLVAQRAANADAATTATTATTAATATNLAAGGAGQLPYQSAAATTAMLAAGTAGQVLTSGGTSAPSWSNSVDYQAFTATGTWTKPTKGVRVFVEIWAAGGGGSAGGGGGGGGYRFKWFNMSDLTATVAVTIPTGGAVDTAGGNATFGAYLTAYGGGSGAPANFGGGGGGGTTSAGASGSGTTGGAGGGGTYSTTAATNGTNFDCGATGPSAASAGYNSYYGGGSGAYGAGAGGSSVYGGAGGGTSAGTSIYGGNGGSSAAAGTAPGGGGGTNGSTTGTAGARGECRVTVF